MRMKYLALIAGLMLVLSLGACKKKEEPVTQPGSGQPGGMFVPPVTEVVVPDEVKAKWNAVELTIEDKEKDTSDDVVVKLGSEYTIPGSNIKIQVGDFLSDFRMEGSVITSASSELNNPAVHVVIQEDEEELFKGWLYSKFPSIHPFMHEKFAITLKSAVEKG